MKKLLFTLLITIFTLTSRAKMGWTPSLCSKAYGKHIKSFELEDYKIRIYELNGVKLQYTFYKDKAIALVFATINKKYNLNEAMKNSEIFVGKGILWKQDSKNKNYYKSEKYLLLITEEGIAITNRVMPQGYKEFINNAKIR